MSGPGERASPPGYPVPGCYPGCQKSISAQTSLELPKVPQSMGQIECFSSHSFNLHIPVTGDAFSLRELLLFYKDSSVSMLLV